MERIPLFKVNPIDERHAASVLNSGMIGEGATAEEFRGEVCEIVDHKSVVLTNSCTSAMIMALRLSGVRAGDYVISSPFTFIATNCAIKAIGAIPLWCDIEKETLCLDLSLAAELCRKTPNVRAILAVCTAGLVPLTLREHSGDVPLILDCAHALQTYEAGCHISDWADYSCFSFQSIKHLTTGDGGALTCNTNFARAEKLKWFGMSRQIPPGMSRIQHQLETDVEEFGYKFHMNDVAAAVGLGNVDFAKTTAVPRSKENAEYYQQELRGLNGITLLSPSTWSRPSWWLYGFFCKRRNELMQILLGKGIDCMPPWRRNDSYTAFGGKRAHLPVVDVSENHILFIPNGWWVDNEARERIVSIIKQFCNAC